MRKVQALIDELGQLAASYRAASDRAATTASTPRQLDALAAQYLESLAALCSTGWAGALGEACELPDERMPRDYLERRARLLDALEDDLARLAMDYRSAATDAAMADAVRGYHAAMNEMFRVGHWLGVPDPDSQLPLEDMPPTYKARRLERIRHHNAGSSPG